MCEELNLIQTTFGIYDLKSWSWDTIGHQLSDIKGLYLVRCKINNKLLIGEGIISARLNRHMSGYTNNNSFNEDYTKYGQKEFELYGIIIEENEQTRKDIEYRLHKYFQQICYNVPCPPKWIIERLYNEGKTKKEISEILGCSMSTLHRRIKLDKTSNYRGVYFDKDSNNFRARYQGDTTYRFGNYKTDISAAQNRDYFLVKNSLLHKEKLNFHNIDYTNFQPHKTINGQVNKHLL